uniref:Chaperone DnaJ C-terminal domain-containing protein n=1 Tax=Craspedostauros australis TaxID=1486917 RepID=A0A7R9ZSK6_9STRA
MGTFKSVFVQKVKVPLEDLYNGSQGVEVKVRSNLWTRNCAAIRGGAFYINLYQAFIYSLPLLRTSRTLALVVASAIFHWALPKPATTTFQLNLQPGYKGGKTKLKYASNSYDQPEVVFELQEKRHPRYQRVHNDLHTTVTISTEDAKNGCNIDIKTLDSKVIKIRINSIKDPSQGTDLRIKGKGWPIRNAKAVQTADEMDHGDLVVHIRVRRKRGWSLSHECGD